MEIKNRLEEIRKEMEEIGGNSELSPEQKIDKGLDLLVEALTLYGEKYGFK